MRSTRGSASSSSSVFCASKRAAGPGHTHGYNLFLCVIHRICSCFEGNFSVATTYRQVKNRRVHHDESANPASTAPAIPKRMYIANSRIVVLYDPGSRSPLDQREPMQVVVEFIKRINAGNLDQIAELLTNDHIFQDALGKRFIGKETLRQGWKMYYAQVADYKIRGEDFFVDKNVVAIFGTASGTSKINGQFTAGGLLGNSRRLERGRARRPDRPVVCLRRIFRSQHSAGKKGLNRTD